jgi:hypothetical protein
MGLCLDAHITMLIKEIGFILFPIGIGYLFFWKALQPRALLHIIVIW